jgi:putative hemolysin
MFEANLILMLIILVALLALSAFFSGSETALMAISRLRLRHLAETRPRRTKIVEHILKKPEKLIGTILLGNNLVNVGMSAIATALAISFWGERGIAYVTAILTLVILIFAEITPKVYAKYFNERVSFFAAPVINVVMALFNPVVVAVTHISSKILHLVGVDVSKIKRPLMTEEEIKTCIKMGWDEGAITTEERKMLSRVFTMNDRTVGQVMVPRDRMTILDIDASLKDILRSISKTGYSRFPIKKGDNLDIVGFIHAKDVFRLMEGKKPHSLETIVRPPYFVPGDRKIDAQLRSFQIEKLHQAVVLDNEGKVAGLVTLEDILEELVGSIQDEHDLGI